MLDIGSNKYQGVSGGLSSRPSQISSIRRNEGTIRRKLNHSSSPPLMNLRGMSADAGKRWGGSTAQPKPKPSPTVSTNRRYGSADAGKRWGGSTAQPKPKPSPTVSTNRRYGSADAGERWGGSTAQPKPKPSLTVSTNRRYGSADAGERWSNPTNSRGTYNIRSGDTLSAIAQRELGSSSRWREIKKADGSSFSASEAGRLQVGQQISLAGTSSSTNNRAGGQTNLRGMSADGAAAWSNVDRNRGDQTAPHSSLSQVSNGVGNTVRGIHFGQRQRYQLEPQRGGTVTGIRDTHAGKVRGNPPKPVGSPLIRFDTPDKTTKHPHININPALTGKPDPHTRISPTTLRVAGGTARTLETVGRVARPVAFATDTIRLADAVRADGGLGRNTAVTAGSVAGGWGGAAGGAWAGAQGGSTLRWCYWLNNSWSWNRSRSRSRRFCWRNCWRDWWSFWGF